MRRIATGTDKEKNRPPVLVAEFRDGFACFYFVAVVIRAGNDQAPARRRETEGRCVLPSVASGVHPADAG